MAPNKIEGYIYLVLHIPLRSKVGEKYVVVEKEIDFVIGKEFIITTKYDTIEPLHNFSKVFETAKHSMRALLFLTIFLEFSTVQQGAVNMLVILTNVGTNTMNYDFQQYNGTAWVDMSGSTGVPYQGTISAGQSISLLVVSSYAQVQLTGYASGGTTLAFSLSRLFNRVSGGAVPLVTF